MFFRIMNDYTEANAYLAIVNIKKGNIINVS